MPPSNSYKIIVGAGITALDGTKLTEEYSAGFTTHQWKVTTSEIEFIDADRPIIFLTFNQKMKTISLKKETKSACGKIDVKQISKEKAEEFSLDSNRTYAFKYKKRIGLSKSCELDISENALSEFGPNPGKVHTYKFKTYGNFKISSVSCGWEDKIAPKDSNETIIIQDCDPGS